MKRLKETKISLSAAEESDIFIHKPEEDQDASDEGEEEGDERAHAKLLKDMGKISKKKKQAAKREVRTTVGAVAGEVDAADLLKRIGSTHLKKANKRTKTLPKPLEKHVVQRAKRAAGYENVSMEVGKWAKVVELRRNADTLSFPLKKNTVQLSTVDKVEPPKAKTELEEEIYSLLEGAKLVKKKETAKERAIRQAMSLEEVKEKMRTLWREKEMKRRYEEKARKQNLSKSKTHHRILRREKKRKWKTELEELYKKNPEAALEKLKEMEFLRIQERMSQRHRSSKWAKFQGLRATRDKEAMAALKENAKIHQELKRKTKKEESSDSEDSASEQQKEEAMTAGTYDPMNPWTASLAKRSQGTQGTPNGEEGDETFTKFKKFWDEVNRRKAEERKAQAIAEAREKKEKDEQKEGKQEESEAEKSEEEEGKTDKNSENTENTDQTKSIDYMFSKAEDELKKKMKRKLQKLGIEKTEVTEWTKVKKKKGDTKIKSNKAAIVEEFDFTCKKSEDKIVERLERVRTLEDTEELGQREEATDKIQQAFLTLGKGEATTKANGGKGCDKPSEDKDKKTKKKVEVDPTKFIQVNTEKLHTAMPDNMTVGDDAMDDSEEEEEDAEDVIREAFAEDYLIDEFKSAKEAANKESEPQDVSLALPGWGDWTGPNMKVSTRKQNIFRIRGEKKKPHKYSTVGNVIYNEGADVHQNLRKAMVSELPYQFKTVKDFEASVRAPVGRTFVPEAMHKKLTAPAVTTKMGTVIEPMTETELLAVKKKISVKK